MLDSTVENDLWNDLRELRKNRYKNRIGNADTLLLAMGCDYEDSEEKKVSYFLNLIKLYIKDAYMGEVLLASMGLLEGYDEISKINARRLEYYKNGYPTGTWKTPIDSLRDIEDRAIDELIQKIKLDKDLPELLAKAPQNLSLPKPLYPKKATGNKTPAWTDEVIKTIDENTKYTPGIESGLKEANKKLDEITKISSSIDRFNSIADAQASAGLNREYMHSLPLRNYCYVSRKNQDSLLDDIWSYFQNNEKTPNAQVIHGMGGVGKTQIAIEYAYRFWDENEYPVICWLTADSIFGNAQEFLKYMERDEYEKLHDMKDNASALISAFRQWFESNSKWLLIFDDVDNRKQIEPYIPRKSNGHILITSRSVLKGIEKSTHIKEFDIETAVGFLIKRTKQDNQNDAKALAARLGCFPLALEQAAAYITAWPDVDFDKYLSLLDGYGLEIFKYDEDNDRDYTHTVNTVWEISMDKLSETSEAAGHLLCMCAYFAPDDIDFSIFVKKAELYMHDSLDEKLKFTVNNNLFAYNGIPMPLIRELQCEIGRRNLLAEITKYSLMRFDHDKGTLSMPRLLQEVVRSILSENPLHLFCCIRHLASLELMQSVTSKIVTSESLLDIFDDKNHGIVNSSYSASSLFKKFDLKLPEILCSHNCDNIIMSISNDNGYAKINCLAVDFAAKLPHICSIVKHVEPMFYKYGVRTKGVWYTFWSIGTAYYALGDFSAGRLYYHKALAFAYAEGSPEKDISSLAQYLGHLYLEEEFEKGNYEHLVGYKHHAVSSWIENNLIKVKIELMEEKSGKKHPLIIDIPYLFKTARA